ncbi:MAG: hypothetical protein AAF462_09090, partial [Thermodesulfobacteriota bacterium]
MRAKVLKPIGIFLLIVALLTGAMFFVVQSSFFKQFLRVTTNAVVSSLTNQGFIIGSIEGDFLRGIILRDVSFEIEGETFIESDEIFIDYSLPLLLDSSMLFSKVIPLQEVSITGLQINLVQFEDRTWNFEKLGAWEEPDPTKDSPDWNIFIQNAILSQAKIRVDDRYKKQIMDLKSDKIDLTIKMFNIDKRVEIQLRRSNLGIVFQDTEGEILYLDDIVGKGTYRKHKTSDEFSLNELKFTTGEIAYSLNGTAKNLQQPEFDLRAAAVNIGQEQGLGKINLNLLAKGTYENYQYLRANGDLKLVNSNLRGEKITGGIKNISVDGADVDLKGGTINTDFGKLLFSGGLDLKEMLADGKDNKLDLDINIESLNASKVLEMFETNAALEENKELEEQVAAILDASLSSVLNVQGNWNRDQNFQSRINIANLYLTGSDVGELRVSGPINLKGDFVEYELSTNFVNTDLAFLLKDEAYKSSLNSEFQLKGSVPLVEDEESGPVGSIKGQILPSTISGLEIKEGRVEAEYGQNVLDLKSLLIDADSLKVKASGNLRAAGSSGIKYNVEIKDLGVFTKLSPDFDLRGAVSINGNVKGDLSRPRLILNATGSDITNELEGFEINKLKLNADSYISYKDPRVNIKGKITGADINGQRIKSINFTADSRGELIEGSLDVLGLSNTRYKLGFTLTELNENETKIQIDQIRLNFQKEVLENKNPVLISVLKDKIKLSSFNLYHKDNYIVGEADIGFDYGLRGSLELKQLNLHDVSELLNLYFPLKGRLTGQIALDTSLKYPDVKANLRADNLELMSFSSDELLLNLLVSKNGINFNLDVNDKSKKILTASGKANVDLTAPDLGESYRKSTIDLSIQSDGVDMSPIAAFNPQLEEIQGKLKIDLSAFGTGENPNFAGKIEADDVVLDLYPLRN